MLARRKPMSLAAPLVAVSMGLAGCGSDEPKVPTKPSVPTTTSDENISSNPPPPTVPTTTDGNISSNPPPLSNPPPPTAGG